MKKAPLGFLPIISIDRKNSRSLQYQIYEGYRRAIVDRRLRPGQRVPSTRMLACDLGISRIPVLNAYAQLSAEGYIESRVGAGTCISNSLPSQVELPKRNSDGITAKTLGRRSVALRASILPPFGQVPWRRGWGAFGVSQVAFDEFPFRIWNSLVVRQCRNICAKSLDYGDPRGSQNLREAVATYLRTARGVRCDADQVIIVSGSQQALSLTARVLFDPGSRVGIEEPGYRLARDVMILAGCEVVPLPVDYEGLNIATAVKKYPDTRGVFVTPSHQYPLGVTMNASRRLRLLDWAESMGAWIIEDDYDSEFRYDGMPIPSLQGLDSNSRVIYLGTFSKILFPSLRLGYMVVPPNLIDHFMSIRLAMDLGPPGLFQAVLADFISEGHFARHIRRMRTLYAGRRHVLIDSIRKELGFAVDITGGQAGMHLSLTLPSGFDDREAAERAAKQNLWLFPLSSSYMGRASRQGFILGFGSVAAEEIPSAVSKVAKLVAFKPFSLV